MAGDHHLTPTAADDVRWLDAEEQGAWRAFVQTSRWLFNLLDGELKAAHDLSHDDYALLVALSEAPESRMRMSELAVTTLESRSRLSHHVGRLEIRGLVERESCPNDRRGLLAVLTPMGRAVLEAAAPDHVEGVRSHFIDLVTPADLATMTAALTEVCNHIEELRAPCMEAAIAAEEAGECLGDTDCTDEG